MNYHQQMKHPLWQKKRLEVLEHHEFTCQQCQDTEQTLHVHHPFYKRGAMIWEYELEELRCLCEKCHKEAHALDERLKKLVALSSPDTKWNLIGYLETLAAIKEYESIERENYETEEEFKHALLGVHAFTEGSFEVVFGIAMAVIMNVMGDPLRVINDVIDLAKKNATILFIQDLVELKRGVK